MVNATLQTSVVLWIILSSVVAHAAPPDENHERSPSPIVISDLVVVLVNQASIAATIEGSVREVCVDQGDSTGAGDLIVQLDDQKMQLEESRAEYSLQIARHERDTSEDINAEVANVSERQRLIAEQMIRRQESENVAANGLKVQAAEKAEAVAQNEWTRAKTAKQNFSDAVSESEIEALDLAYQRSQLETKEARFQRELTAIDVRLQTAILATLEQQLASAEVALAAARESQQVREIEAEIAQVQYELAQLAAREHQLRTPIDGIVVSTQVRVGDWVRRGQIVARVIGLSRLRVEGFVDATDAQTLRDVQSVGIVIRPAAGNPLHCVSQSIFVSPEIDAVTGEVRFWAEFDNENQRVHPGMKASVEVPR